MMTEFENVKHSFLSGSTLLSLIGAYYLFLGFGASNTKGFPAVLPIFVVLFFAIWMKNKNPLYSLDRAARKNLIKRYQWQWGAGHKVLLSFVFFAFIISVIGVSLVLGADALQAIHIGLGLPLVLFGLVSLIVSYRMQPSVT